jgi:hypothetical protein
VVPREEIAKADVLRIFAIEGPDISKDVALEINACGLIGSMRRKNDGHTIIGSQMYNENGEI